MKKIFIELFAIALTVILATMIVGNIWFYDFPNNLSQSAFEAKQLKEYLVDMIPELEGANAEDVTFDKVGLYRVHYGGHTYIVSDVAVQNNINVFLLRNGSLNYEAYLRNRLEPITFFFVFIFGIILIALVVFTTKTIVRYCYAERRTKKRQKQLRLQGNA